MNELLRGRSLINILLLSLAFIIFFFIFVFFFFIPAGKEYKKINKVYQSHLYLLDQAQMKYEDVSENLKELQAKNRTIILGYENPFDPQAFDRDYSRYFESLQLKVFGTPVKEDLFDVYEVNTTSKISSPTDFYAFLEAVNKSENIISVEFPINFVAKNDTIYASFRMRVFRADFATFLELRDLNTTTEEVAADL